METSSSTSSLLPRSDSQSQECGEPKSMTPWSRRTNASASNLSTSAAITPPESPTIVVTSQQDEHQLNADHPALRPELPDLEQGTSDAPLESQIPATNSFVTNRARKQMWKPWSLRVPLLVLTLGITLTLVVVVWRLLGKSNDNRGLLFAADINELSLWQSFSYRYLSTLLVVLYGLLWYWIDLDVRRLEPYFQLSKHRGVVAEDSISLDYPYQFIATVPITAAKRGHWSVLASTTAFMLVSFALTPFQAGLFAVQTVTVSEKAISSYATGYTPTDKQSDLNAISAQYAYNVAWFNETPRSFMTREYVLAAFGPDHSTAMSNGIPSNFTGSTLLYSVDLECEIPAACLQYAGHESSRGKSSSGCSVTFPANLSTENTDVTKVFRTMYMAHNAAGWSQADYYIPETCTDRFWMSWMKRSPGAIAANTAESNSTSLFCNPTYFQQPVEATISLPEKRVFEVNPKGEKVNLPADMFNATLFEWSTASGTTGELSLDYPETRFPEQKTKLSNLPIDISYLPPMAPFAIAAYPMSDLDAYLDPKILSMSYQAAFRLLFTQQLAQILDAGTDPNTAGAGEASYNMEVVYVVAAFAYIVIGILALTACTCCCLLVLCSRRHAHLSEDPGSIGALMKLVKFDCDLVALFVRLGETNTKVWKDLFRGSRFGLEAVPSLMHPAQLRVYEVPEDSLDAVAKPPSSSTSHESERPTRPLMLRSIVGVLLLAVQTLAIATLIGLYIYSCRYDGIPLPGESRFARQLVENYIPLAVATSLEAAWLVLNRLVCILQPWEELRRGNAMPSRSIDLTYGSLPPQLGLFKAYSARHPKLAAVCLMTLLANVLAVALSGLMVEDGAAIQHVDAFHPRFTPNMKELAGTDIPFNYDKPGNWQGGSTLDPSYQAMSNLTRGTELLPWADDKWAYLPVELPGRGDSPIFQVATPAFGVSVACEPADPAELTYTMSAPNATGGFINFTTAIPQSDGSVLRCREGRRWRFLSEGYLSLFNPPIAARNSMATGMILSSDNASDALSCQQHFFFAWIRADAEVQNPNVITSINKTVITCKATPLQSTATVVVGSDGRVKSSSKAAWLDVREQAPVNEILVSQANNFLIDGNVGWHSSTYPSGFTQYLMAKANESTAASIDVNNPVPSFDEVAPTLERLYRKLYVILLAQNFDLLFEPNAEATTVSGFTYPRETRIYILLPAFVVSVSIMSLYIIVTVWLYLQRPWNKLPRLPTTIASVITYFAASNALRQMAIQSDSVESETERKNWKSGYGTFVGPDGKSHVGIECEKWLVKDDQEVEMVPLHRPASHDEPSIVPSSI